MSEVQIETVPESKQGPTDNCNELKSKSSGRTGKTILTFFTCGLCSRGNQKPENEGEKPKPKPKMQKNKSVTGTIKFETAANIDLFRNILDNSMVGTKLVSKGCICSRLSGGIIACNPPDYTPSTEQVNFITAGFENVDLLKTEGFMIVSHVYELCGYNTDEIYAKTKGDCEYYEALILLTNTALIIGISQSPVDRMKGPLIEIRDMLKNQGF